MMKKVLFITYLFPPHGGVGVHRITKFAKYLPCFSWQPVILTTKNKAGLNLDESLLQDIPAGIRVYKTSCFEPQNYKDNFSFENFSFIKLRDKIIRNFFRFFDFIFVPDEQVLWTISAVLSGINIILKEKIDIIMATGDPFATFIIGYFLKKFTGRPLVLDFRDEWIGGFFLEAHQRKYTWQRKAEVGLEKKLVAASDAVITVTPSIIENFKEKYPNVKTKFYLVPNGYDEDDFDINIKPASDEFIICHSGKLYSLRSPEVLLEAIRILCNKDEEFKKKFKLNFIGEVFQDVRGILKEFQYKDSMEALGFKPHKESVRKMLESSVLCLILDKSPTAARAYTAKIFEYLASNRAVLIFAEENTEVARLAKASPLCYLVQNEIDAAKILASLFSDWKRGKCQSMDNLDFIKNYSRRILTKELSIILGEVTAVQNNLF